MMTPGERITAIREIASALARSEWTDIDLVLGEHSLPQGDTINWREQYDYVIAMLRDARDDQLQQLRQFVVSAPTSAAAASGVWQPGQLKLFASHLATHEKFVAEVGARLAEVGTSTFVAHKSIQLSDEWQDVIEGALRTCDAMVVFLHDGFRESPWCDQEVGFALERRVPILPLGFDLLPYGFMARFQAARCQGDDARDVHEKVINRLVREPRAQLALAEGLTGALEASTTYAKTRRLFGLLKRLPSFTEDQMARLEAAAKTNDQVSACIYERRPVPALIAELVAERGGMTPASSRSPIVATRYEEEPF